MPALDQKFSASQAVCGCHVCVWECMCVPVCVCMCVWQFICVFVCLDLLAIDFVLICICHWSWLICGFLTVFSGFSAHQKNKKVYSAISFQL